MTHNALRSELRGKLLEPGDAEYDASRVVWNGMIDRRPLLIARCRNAADVIASVNYARARDLLISVHSGGHNVAGYAVCDGGLMIDMSLMNAVRIAADLDRAQVGGGSTWADVDAATTPFGRATPGGLIAATGVAGLTLSGGIGWLRGTHGLSCDNILAADVVIADGRLVHTSDTENSDLLWGLKGGGGNFGVVVNFEFRLHPIAAEMMFCAPAYPEERADEILLKWRDYMATAPDEVSGLAEFSTIPRDAAYPEHAWGRRVLTLATVYDGPAEEGERVTQPLRSFGETLIDFSDRIPYQVLQTLYDGLFPKGRDRCYWKSTYLKHLDNEVIREITKNL
ncbi:MAG: FAD-dependent oxidoreductase, partial [Phyllobacterium sp.]|uniref:FAD-binding oxidoreductase n=1 Tax=Phyllobacterium sp. TaxID=1871046 RepID=UPI0030F2802F